MPANAAAVSGGTPARIASTIFACRSGVSFVGRPPACLPSSAATAERLPALADYVAVGRLELEHERAPAVQLGRDHRRAGAGERVDQVAGVVPDRAREHLYRLLRAVAAVHVRVERHLPDGRLAAVADPAGARTAPDRIPNGFVRPGVVAAANREVRLAPDDLGAEFEPGGLDPGGDRRRLQAGVEAVENIAWKQRPGLAPVRAVVVRDRADSPCGVGELALRGRSLPPGRVVGHAVGRIGYADRGPRSGE